MPILESGRWNDVLSQFRSWTAGTFVSASGNLQKGSYSKIEAGEEEGETTGGELGIDSQPPEDEVFPLLHAPDPPSASVGEYGIVSLLSSLT